MDDPSLDRGAHERALAGLARLNRASGAWRPAWRVLRRISGAVADRPIRLLDVATGGADTLAALLRRAARAGLRVDAVACDKSPTALEVARSRLDRWGLEATLLQLDVLRDPLPHSFDLALCSLFLHHLDDADACALLVSLDRAARVSLVNDLRRSPWSLLLVGAASRLLTRSSIVHVDALLSVRAAFTPAELALLARKAGLDDFLVRRAGPARMLLLWPTRLDGARL